MKKPIFWNKEKNEILKEQRGISFEEVEGEINAGRLLDTVDHPNRRLYPHQKVFIVNLQNYIYVVPFVEDSEKIFLKTVIPNRKMTKHYLPERKIS